MGSFWWTDVMPLPGSVRLQGFGIICGIWECYGKISLNSTPMLRTEMFTPEFGRSGRTGSTGGPNRSDWRGEVAQKTIWISPLDGSRPKDQDAYIECLFRTSSERDMPSGSTTRRSAGLTGAPRVQVKSRKPDRLEL
jgi:hypothetical protein